MRSGDAARPGYAGLGDDGRMSEARAGMLLVATPALVDPNFVDTVVLLLDVDAEEDAVLGVVLNRPLDLAIADVMDGWGEVATEPDVLFLGGPVDTDGALGVALLRDPDDVPVGFRAVGGRPADGPPLVGRIGLVDLETPVELIADSLAELRIFVGYSGWGMSQLEDEIAEGSWYVVPAEIVDAFRGDTAELRREVLRRQPGELAWHSTRPFDPDLN